MRKTIYGFGVNDADYNVSPKINGKYVKCHFYTAWHSMLNRCYCEKYQSRKPSYAGCYVCEEWRLFSNFKSWMEKQDWKGKHLDKDIISPGNNVYSPDTCAFVSRLVNSFVNVGSSRSKTGAIGFSFDRKRNKFRADFSNPITKKKGLIGRYATEEEARNAWRSMKHQFACVLAGMETDERVSHALRHRYIK